MLKFSVKKIFKDNLYYILGGVFVLFLFSLRFYHLTILPVFADEAIYIRWAQVMKAEETLRFLPLSDGKQPLFMWIVIPFLKFIHDPLMAGRTVSVLSGLGTLIGVSFLSYLLFKSKKVAFAAALIYAVSPFTFFFNRMALVDSLLCMFGVWTFIFSYLSITNKRLDFAMLAGFALGGAWLTKSPALFFALMLSTLLIFSDRKKYLVSIFYLLTTILIGYGFYNILRLGPNYSMIAVRNLDYVWPLGHIFLSPFDPLKPWLLQSWQWIVMMGPWELVVFGLTGVLINLSKNWKQTVVLLIWLLGPIFIESEFAKVLTARYIFFTIPFLIIIASSVFESLSLKWLRVVGYGLLVIFIAQSSIFDYLLLTNPAKANLPRSERSGYLEEWTAGQGIAEAANCLENFKFQNPNSKVVVGTEGYFGTLPDGLQMYLNNDKAITIIGVGLNFSDIPKSLLDSRKSGNVTFLLINNDRFKGDPEKDNLELIASYKKTIRPNGSYQSLDLYRLK